MKMEFTVKRNRGSVTQGTATVLLNGIEVIITDKNRGNDYGDIIGGWQSSKPDSAFIKGVLFPFFTNAEKIKNRIMQIIG